MKAFYKVGWQIALTIVVSAAVVIMLYMRSPGINQDNNGFNRVWRAQWLKKEVVIDNADSIFSISGASNTAWYFAGPHADNVFITNEKLGNKRSQYLQLDFVPKDRYCITSIDSPYVFLYFGNDHAIAVGNMNDNKVQTHTWFDKNFSRAVALSPVSVLLRGFQLTKQVDQVFYKIGLSDSSRLMGDSILPKYGDAGFSNDGLLHYDKAQAKLCYVSFYSNGIVLFDTTFSKVQHYRTIDSTFNNNGVVQSSKENEKRYLVTDKSRLINLYNTVNNGMLYNLSLLKADNESVTDFSANAVVDMYDLKKGVYTGSFYIPHVNGEKVLQFEISNNRLVAVYKDKIVLYGMEAGH
jgi:hypothetical protein